MLRTSKLVRTSRKVHAHNGARVGLAVYRSIGHNTLYRRCRLCLISLCLVHVGTCCITRASKHVHWETVAMQMPCDIRACRAGTFRVCISGKLDDRAAFFSECLGGNNILRVPP
jgi:hypothetical protein